MWGKLIQVLIMLAIFYGLYKCLWTGQRRQPAPPTTSTSYSDVSGSYARNSAGTGVGGTGGGPGFWSGKATSLCVTTPEYDLINVLELQGQLLVGY